MNRKDKQNLDVILQKFISVNSAFYNPEYPRKLILRSSTIVLKNYMREIISRDENDLLQESINDYIQMLNSFLLTNKKAKKASTEVSEAKNTIENLDESKKLIKKFPSKRSEKSEENSEMKSIKSINQKIKDLKTPKKFDSHFNEGPKIVKNSHSVQEDISINQNISESSEPTPFHNQNKKTGKKIYGDSKNMENTMNQTGIKNNLDNEEGNNINKINEVGVTENKEENLSIQLINKDKGEDSENNNLNFEIFKSENFMDLKKVCRKVNVFFEILDDNKIEKKIKKLLSFINPKEQNKNFVVCSKQKNILILKETLKKRNIDFLIFNAGIVKVKRYFII